MGGGVKTSHARNQYCKFDMNVLSDDQLVVFFKVFWSQFFTTQKIFLAHLLLNSGILINKVLLEPKSCHIKIF